MSFVFGKFDIFMNFKSWSNISNHILWTTVVSRLKILFIQAAYL